LRLIDAREPFRHFAGMLQPLPKAIDLLAALKEALSPDRPPLVIGIDGRWGAGKSSLASWLSWQLEMPVVHLDLYVIPGTDPLEWRYGDLGRAIRARLSTRCPVIVEGICLCEALEGLDLAPDFLVWMENESGPESSPHEPTRDYIRDFSPHENADFRLTWGGSEVARLSRDPTSRGIL
jgi:hypothetical protein